MFSLILIRKTVRLNKNSSEDSKLLSSNGSYYTNLVSTRTWGLRQCPWKNYNSGDVHQKVMIEAMYIKKIWPRRCPWKNYNCCNVHKKIGIKAMFTVEFRYLGCLWWLYKTTETKKNNPSKCLGLLVASYGSWRAEDYFLLWTVWCKVILAINFGD